MERRTTSSSRDRRWLAFVVLAACTSPDGDEVALPGGPPGIGFDDLRYSPELGAVVAPGGRAGRVYLVDPERESVATVDGLGALPDYTGDHDDGPTSADVGRGLLFVTDRTTRELLVVDPATRAIASRVPLGASPDYVRYVAKTDEVWVSEPSAARIEIFALDGAVPRYVAAIPVENGPESLVVDAARNRVYTHRWQASTVAFDVTTRAKAGEWPNGCASSRGIDVEPEHGWVLTACSEGTVTVVDPTNGAMLGSARAGSGNDVMGYARGTRHVYVAGFACDCLTVLGLSNAGSLEVLGRFDAPGATHCVTADDRGHAWVCDPDRGALRRVSDPFPSWSTR